MEILFEIVAEIVLMLIGEAVGEGSVASAKKATKDKYVVEDAWIQHFLVFVFGGLLGVISVVFVGSIIQDPTLRIVNLVVAPIVGGVVMNGIGVLKRKKGKRTFILNKFLGGFLFALGFALARYLFIDSWGIR